MKVTLTLALILPPLLLAAAGCSGESLTSWSELAALRAALIREYGHQGINVVVQDGNTLGVSFVNSPFNGSGEAERSRKAQEVARFAEANYASAGKIDRIWVAFARSRTYFYVFHTGEVVSVFLFEKGRIEAGDLLGGPGKLLSGLSGAAKAAASYSKPRDETTVTVNYLQLYGDAKDGLMLIALFTVPGDRVVAPETVTLEFSSYSARGLFSRDRRITISADGEALASGNARLKSSGRGADGVAAEFLSYDISYRQLLKMVEGREVEISLGPQRVELTPEQLQSLRGMKECVDSHACY
jgi:hypothetical protein